MKTKQFRLFTSALLLGALVSTAGAQGQPSGPASLDAGLIVREAVSGMTTASGGVPLITVTGEPGSNYGLISEFNAAWLLQDGQTLYAPALGALGLENVAVLNLGIFVDPLGGVVGQIPASGFQNLNLVAPLPNPGAFTGMELQAVVFELDGQIRFTNSQIRAIQEDPPAALGFTQQLAYPGTIGQNWDDIEQGDLDGDGDLDRIGISQDGQQRVQVFLYENVNPLQSVLTPFQDLDQGGPGEPTSAELADFNGDGFLDLAVAISGASPDYLRVWINQGLDGAGNWLGFVQLPVGNIEFEAPGLFASPTDLETGDVNGDGAIDIFMTCASNPAIGEQNRLFLQVGPADVTVFEEATAGNLPGIQDDTEDCEFLDYDLDGDLDIVIAVIDASSQGADGVDYILENQGGAQGGVQGVYLANLNLIPIATDESADVVVADFDGDGFPDLFFANWFETAAPSYLPNLTTPVPDRLLMNQGGAGFGPAVPVPAAGDWAGTDAEVADFDLDGDLDLIVASGSLRNAMAAGAQFTTGTRVILNPLVGGGGWANFNGLAVFPAETADLDLRDIETGDWAVWSIGDAPQVIAGQWFDKDFGCAPLGGAGLSSMSRN